MIVSILLWFSRAMPGAAYREHNRSRNLERQRACVGECE
jgi:hypothetical protein